MRVRTAKMMPLTLRTLLRTSPSDEQANLGGGAQGGDTLDAIVLDVTGPAR